MVQSPPLFKRAICKPLVFMVKSQTDIPPNELLLADSVNVYELRENGGVEEPTVVVLTVK